MTEEGAAAAAAMWARPEAAALVVAVVAVSLLVLLRAGDGDAMYVVKDSERKNCCNQGLGKISAPSFLCSCFCFGNRSGFRTERHALNSVQCSCIEHGKIKLVSDILGYLKELEKPFQKEKYRKSK